MTQKKQKKLFKLAHSWSCIIVFLQNYIEIFIIFIQSTNQNIFYYNLLTKLASNDSKKYTIRFRKIWSAWKYLKPGADILLLFIEFLFSWINSFFFKGNTHNFRLNNSGLSRTHKICYTFVYIKIWFNSYTSQQMKIFRAVHLYIKIEICKNYSSEYHILQNIENVFEYLTLYRITYVEYILFQNNPSWGNWKFLEHEKKVEEKYFQTCLTCVFKKPPQNRHFATYFLFTFTVSNWSFFKLILTLRPPILWNEYEILILLCFDE